MNNADTNIQSEDPQLLKDDLKVKSNHIPVLLTEVVENLNIKTNDVIIDCNFGDGGHSKAFIDKGAKVIGLDIDASAIEMAKTNFKNHIERKLLIMYNENFKNIDVITDSLKLNNTVTGILFDLGFSTRQIKTGNLGLSFNDDTELDMRMDKNLSVKASDLLKVIPTKQLAIALSNYGDVNDAHNVSKYLKNYANNNSFINAKALGDDISIHFPRRGSKIHPATKIFMGLRIIVNAEFYNLEIALKKCHKILKQHGRIAVIVFHSLEEKIVTESLNIPEFTKITKSAITPSFEELKNNISSRSAKLYIYEKN